MDNWIFASLKAFFNNAANGLSGVGCDEEGWNRGIKRFADAAFPLALALRIDWNRVAKKKGQHGNEWSEPAYLPREKKELSPSIISLRSAYCDFVARRFARESRLPGGGGQGDAVLDEIMNGNAYKDARKGFAETDIFAPDCVAHQLCKKPEKRHFRTSLARLIHQ